MLRSSAACTNWCRGGNCITSTARRYSSLALLPTAELDESGRKLHHVHGTPVLIPRTSTDRGTGRIYPGRQQGAFERSQTAAEGRGRPRDGYPAPGRRSGGRRACANEPRPLVIGPAMVRRRIAYVTIICRHNKTSYNKQNRMY